jgi:hypothetical protein
VAAPLKEQIEKWRRELEDTWNPPENNISQWFSRPMPILMPMFLALLFLGFLPCIILCLLLLIKSLTSCTSRDTNLSKTVQKTAMRAPTRTQESEALTPHSAPCQQEAANRPMLCPNFLSSAPTLIIVKEKMGE